MVNLYSVPTDLRRFPVALFIFISLLLSISSFARDDPPAARLIQGIKVDGALVQIPVGLTYSSNDNTFFFGQSAASGYEISVVSLLGGHVRSSRIEAVVSDPINMSFDAAEESLLFLSSENFREEVSSSAGSTHRH